MALLGAAIAGPKIAAAWQTAHVRYPTRLWACEAEHFHFERLPAIFAAVQRHEPLPRFRGKLPPACRSLT